jgi:hypothetical protein
MEAKRGVGRPALSTLHRQQADEILNKLIFDKDSPLLFGRDKLFYKLKQDYTEEQRKKLGLSRRYVMQFLKRSQVHATHAPVHDAKTIQRTVMKRPFSKVTGDLKDMQAKASNGYNYIIAWVDNFSKYTFLRPLKSKATPDVVSAMKSILDSSPQPWSVAQVDNGSEWLSAQFKKLFADRDIKIVYSMPYQPRSNGLVERMNGTIARQISMWMNASNRSDWENYLPVLQKTINNTMQSSTKRTPQEIVDGNANQTRETYETLYKKAYGNADQPVAPIEQQKFEKGDRVRLRLNYEKAMSGPTWSRQAFAVRAKGRSPYGPGWYKAWVQLNDAVGQPLPQRYYMDQIMPYTDSDIIAAREETYIVRDFLEPDLYVRGAERVPGVWTRWMGYVEPTLERVDLMETDVPKEYKKWAQSRNVKWKQNARGEWKFTWDQ